MKFLVTGARGFVAPHLIDYLKKKGHEAYESCSNLAIQEATSLPFTVNDFDGVFHLAGKTHPPTSFDCPAEYFAVNTCGTINLMSEIINRRSPCVFMQCSTPEVYGIMQEGVDIMETTKVNPMNPYGVSKAACDLYVSERARNKKIRAFITRASSHTGPGRPSRYSISSDAFQIAKILKGKQEKIIKVGNLNSMRSVLDVRDVVRAYYMLMLLHIEGKGNNGEIYNISYGEPQKMAYYLAVMLKMYELNVAIQVDRSLLRPIDIPYQNLNSIKMREATGWVPEMSIERTLMDLVEYWKVRI